MQNKPEINNKEAKHPCLRLNKHHCKLSSYKLRKAQISC